MPARTDEWGLGPNRREWPGKSSRDMEVLWWREFASVGARQSVRARQATQDGAPSMLAHQPVEEARIGMVYIAGGVVALVLAAMVTASLTGHLRMRSCCSIADPANDLRMRAAFEDDGLETG